DLLFARKEPKMKAMIEEVRRRHELGQPILIGTSSVESSEEVSSLLSEAKLPHNVLNAKNHEREADIIKHAGERGAITVATNMAGRGTDIKISDEIRALGGLCVIGTERHESRRIDNQLRGRSGRQGDPGYSRFYISFDDELLKRFASDAMQNIAKNMDDQPLESKMFMNVVTGAQKKIEGQNFDMRKNLLDYDDVLSKQRQIIYKKRDAIMFANDIKDLVQEQFELTGRFLAGRAVPKDSKDRVISADLLKQEVEPRFLPVGTINPGAFDDSPADEVAEDLNMVIYKHYLSRRREWGEEIADRAEREIVLRCIDRNWTKHIDTMSHLREGIHLRSYANTNPLQDYVNEGYNLFKEMMDTIAVEGVLNLLNVRINRPVEKTDADKAVEDSKQEKPKVE
ncbi:MAG TPA: preprotein translocase subunit SecA, partial [Bacilli bacterium]|nr:preprotein translocase subunit SecA [Bacilli bacterium]